MCKLVETGLKGRLEETRECAERFVQQVCFILD
jgi:hypothetical protein